MENLTMELTVSSRDLKAFFNYTMWIKSKLPVPCLVFVCFISVLLIFLGSWFILLGLAMLVLSALFVVTRFRIQRRFLRAYQNQPLRRFLLDMDGTGFTMEDLDLNTKTRYLWKNIREIVEYGRYIYIYLELFSAVIIPKTSFSIDEIQNLKDTLRGIPGVKSTFHDLT